MGLFDSILPSLMSLLSGSGNAAASAPAGAMMGGSAVGGGMGGGGSPFSLGNQGFSALNPMSLLNQASGLGNQVSGMGAQVNTPSPATAQPQVNPLAQLASTKLPGMSSTESALIQLYMKYMMSRSLARQQLRAPGFSSSGSPAPTFSLGAPPQYALPRLG